MTKNNSENMFLIVDCNNFFVSCERIFAPHLNNKPVVVLSNNDGCIISRSNEAKAIGIKMGMPYFKARDLIELHKIQVFSSNYSLYGDMSNRVMQILEEFAPEIEYYSIDEAFLKLKNIGNLENYAHIIRDKIKKWTNIPVSIGIAPNKTLAKLANIEAKKNGVYFIDNDEKRLELIKKTDIGEIWGIGRNWNKFLKQLNINTAFEFSEMPDQWLRQNLKIIGLKTAWELRGISCIDISQEVSEKKSLTVSRSFSKDVIEFDELKEALITFSSKICEKLRNNNQTAKHIIVYIKSNKFKDGAYCSLSAGLELENYTNYTPNIIKAGIQILQKIYKPGLKYKKLGVYLCELSSDKNNNINLFEKKSDEKNENLMKAIDHLNKKLGNKTVFYLSSGINPKWVPKVEMESNKFTTKWDGMLKVK